MSPSPEKIEGQQPAGEQSTAEAARGLQMQARVTAPTWEIGLSGLVHDFTPGEVILILDDNIAAGTRVTIQINMSSFVGDILYCSPSGSRWEAHVSFDDVDATGPRLQQRERGSAGRQDRRRFRRRAGNRADCAVTEAKQHRGPERGKHRAGRGAPLPGTFSRALP